MHRLTLPLLLAILLGRSANGHALAASRPPHFTSSRLLLLKHDAFPRGYRYRYYFVRTTVEEWDQNIPPIMAIDRKYGWQEAAEEVALDPKKQDVSLSVQLFGTPAGANSDFSQFFTNSHPQTRFIPGASWLDGTSVKAMGDRATLYHMIDESSRCPGHRTTGLSFVYANGIFSATVCSRTVGDAGAKDLSRRLLARAHKVTGR